MTNVRLFLLMTLLSCVVAGSVTGCSLFYRQPIPQMTLPPEPEKPAIKSSVIVQNSIPYIGYTVADALKFYEYLLEKDGYEEKLRFRINEMNRMIRP